MSILKHYLYDWAGGNEALFRAINQIRGPEYTQLMHEISWLGDHERFPLYLLIITGVVALKLLLKLIRNDSGRRFYFAMWFGVLLVMVAGYAANGAATLLVKDTLALPRPYVALAGTEKIYKLEQTQPKDDYRSFPSGHVAFTTFMVMALWPVLGSFWQMMGMVSILLVAWSRLALGMHFPADVAGSVLITVPLMIVLREIVYRILARLMRL